MRRYKIVACIILILAAFTFVLAAPVSVQEVCEACAGAVDGGGDGDVKVGPVKRAGSEIQKEEEPLQSQDQGSSSVPDYVSGTHPNPSLSSEPEGEANLIQPGTSTRIRPASPNEAESDLFPPLKKMRPSSGEVYSEMLPNPLPPPGGEGDKPSHPAPSSEAESVLFPPLKNMRLPSSEVYSEMPPNPLPPPGGEGDKPSQPASSTKAKSVSWAPSMKVHLPSGESYTEQLPPDSPPASPPAAPLPPGQEGNQPKMAAQQSSSIPEYNLDELDKMLSKLKFTL